MDNTRGQQAHPFKGLVDYLLRHAMVLDVREAGVLEGLVHLVAGLGVLVRLRVVGQERRKVDDGDADVLVVGRDGHGHPRGLCGREFQSRESQDANPIQLINHAVAAGVRTLGCGRDTLLRCRDVSCNVRCLRSLSYKLGWRRSTPRTRDCERN